MRRRLLSGVAFFLWLSACAPEKIDEFQLDGEILRLDEQYKIAIIRHKDIRSKEGRLWMESMTMEFPVKDPAEFARLRRGLRIQASVFVRDSDLSYWIANIRTTLEER
jgi:Cu/Ag efflux protein CusF